MRPGRASLPSPLVASHFFWLVFPYLFGNLSIQMVANLDSPPKFALTEIWSNFDFGTHSRSAWLRKIPRLVIANSWVEAVLSDCVDFVDACLFSFRAVLLTCSGHC